MADPASTLLNIGAGILTGLITAAASVRFALRRFRAERTWERKAAAYTEIFDALYHVQKNARLEVRQVEEGERFDEAYEKEVGNKANEGYDAIRRAAIKGTFVVGERAAKMLDELVRQFDDRHYERDFYEEITADLSAVTKAIAELRVIAKADLTA